MAATPRRAGNAAIPFGTPNTVAVGQLEELRAQIQFLDRRNQYLQTVGALFRQKVALIVRECVRTSHMGPAELQQLYSATMEVIAKAEHDTQTEMPPVHHDDPDGAVSVNNANAAGPSMIMKPFQRSAEAKEDVRKAHLICVALQEKNDAKQREMELRRAHAELTEKYDDLVDRHKKMLLLQGGVYKGGDTAAQGGPSAVNAAAVASMKDLYESRIKELEQAVVALKKENISLRGGGGGGGSVVHRSSTGRAAVHHVDPTDDDDEPEIIVLPENPTGSSVDQQTHNQHVQHEAVEGLTRQNHLLKARVNRLKEELLQLKSQSLGSTMQLNEGLDSLLSKISEQQRQMDEREATIQQLTHEKRELAKECVAHRSQVDMYVKQLELFVKDADTTHLSSARIASHVKGETQNLSSAVDEYLQQIHQKDEVIRSLMQQLRDEKQSHQERVLEVRALGVQLQTFRTKLDALQAQQQQRDHQQAMMGDMHARLLSAVSCIQETQNTTSLASKLDFLSAKLRDMETVDLQLRQKEDDLVIARDELEQTREERDELLETLGSISVMFAHFPKSVSEVEKLVIQVEELKEEVRRCSEEHSSPDMLRVEGRMELRQMELENRHKQQTSRQKSIGRGSLSRRDSTELGPSNSRARSQTHQSASDESSHHSVPDDNIEDEDRWEAELEKQLSDIMNIPPLAPLSDFASKLQGSGQAIDAARQAAQSTTTATLAAAAPQASPPRSSAQASSGLGFLSPSGGPGTVQDVRLTFQLFDDHATGVLSADVISLCLATLGIHRSLPTHVKEMSEDQFLAFCCGQLAE